MKRRTPKHKRVYPVLVFFNGHSLVLGSRYYKCSSCGLSALKGDVWIGDYNSTLRTIKCPGGSGGGVPGEIIVSHIIDDLGKANDE